MGDTLQQATDPVTQTVGDPVQTVDNTVQQAVGDPVQTVDNTVQQAVGDPVQTVDNTVQQAAGGAGQTVDNTVQQAAGGAGQTVDNTTEAASSAVDGSVVGHIAGKGGAALDGATATIGQSADRVADASAPLSDKVATILGPTSLPVPPSDVSAVVPNHLAEHVAPASAGITETGDTVAGGGGILDAIPFGGPDLLAGAEEVVILSAIAVAATSVAFAIRPSAVANAEFFLANARQIPAMCGSVTRQVSAAAAGSARLAAFGADAVVDGVRAKAEDFTEAVSEGFRRQVDRGTSGIGDDADDIRLLMQIGMLLGAAYVAFLTVWFWATRLRWSPRT
jgi:hypothetical protein